MVLKEKCSPGSIDWEEFALSPVTTSSVRIQPVTSWNNAFAKGILEVEFYTAVGMVFHSSII